MIRYILAFIITVGTLYYAIGDTNPFYEILLLALFLTAVVWVLQPNNKTKKDKTKKIE